MQANLAEAALMRFALWKIRSGLQSLIQQEEGQDLVEYALSLVLIAIAAVASVGNFAAALVNYYKYIVTNFPS
jgi:Flp pilus assembly pilin Flp